MTPLYLIDIPRPINSDGLNALRVALAMLADGILYVEGAMVSRDVAWNYITQFLADGPLFLGESDVDVVIDGATEALVARGYVVSTNLPPDDPDASEPLIFDDDVAAAALVLLMRARGNPVEAIQSAALFIAALGEEGASDVFFDAGVLLTRTFDVPTQLHYLKAIGERAQEGA